MHSDWKRNIFAYGSLMSTARIELGRDERRELRTNSRLVGRASVRGLLFDVGPYPAGVLARTGEERIFGEVWRMPEDSEALFRMLDRYEGCARGCPRPYAYVRRKVRVGMEDGTPMVCWMYVWNRPLGDMARIAGGRWVPNLPVGPRAAAA